MKVIVAGGRDFSDQPRLNRILDEMFIVQGNLMPDANYLEIVTGLAHGADALGEAWAVTNWVPVREFPADWDRYKSAAGPIRNAEMAEYADMLIAFWDGQSPGTKNMIQTALREGLEVHVYRY